MAMKICGAYIVKNEAAGLKKSLPTIKGQVDEILVIDTGSTDDTVAVAKAAGAKVLTYAWHDDFAAARNFALEHLTGDWAVFLDGDEYFTAETKDNIRRALEMVVVREPKAQVLLVPWDNIDEESGERLLLSYAPRIFRLAKGLRYAGKIHEELQLPGGKIPQATVLSPEDLCLIHTGYSAAKAKDKARRNLALLLKELSTAKEPEKLYMYLAECYDGLGDGAKAKHYAWLDVAGGRRNIIFAARSYKILLKILAREPQNYTERLATAQKAAQDFPELAEFWAELAESRAYALDYTGALRAVEEAEKAFCGPKTLEPTDFTCEMLSSLKARAEMWRKLTDKAAKLTVSACVMIKNEGKDFSRWLSNAAEWGDELIVLDTGSSDGGRELAVAAGAKVGDYPWRDDFAAARNALISQATGDWLAMLDADETFLAPEGVREFLAWVEHYHPETEAVSLPLLNVDEDEGDRVLQLTSCVRLYKNMSGLNYRGKIHETMYVNDRLPVTYLEPYRLTIRHTGYSTGKQAVKARRNLAILQGEIERRGLRPEDCRPLAQSYAALGNAAAALSYSLRAVNGPVQSRGSGGDMYYLALQCMQALGRPPEEQLALCAEAREKLPRLPDFYALTGIILREREPEKAAEFLTKAAELYSTSSLPGESSYYRSLEERINAAWITIYRRRGDGAMAEDNLGQALKANPYDREALNELYELKAGESPEKQAEALLAFFPEREAGAAFLTRWAEAEGLPELRKYLASLSSGALFPRGEIYRAAKEEDPLKTADMIVGGLAADIKRLIALALALEAEDKFPAGGLSQELLSLMPPGILAVWQSYLGWQEDFPLDDYRAIRDTVLRYGNDEQCLRFALLGKRTGWGEVLATIEPLLVGQRWQGAMDILAQVPAEDPAADGDFWRQAGICLYQLGDKGAAAECLTKAKDMGCIRSDIELYQGWLAGGA